MTKGENELRAPTCTQSVTAKAMPTATTNKSNKIINHYIIIHINFGIKMSFSYFITIIHMI